MDGTLILIVQWAVSVIFGGSIVGTFIFFNSKKRTEKANADKAEHEANSDAIDNNTKFYKVQDEIINDLMSDVKVLTIEIKDFYKTNKTLDIRITDLEATAESNKRKIDELINERCIVVNCPNRNPPIIKKDKCIDFTE